MYLRTVFRGLVELFGPNLQTDASELTRGIGEYVKAMDRAPALVSMSA